MLFSRRLQLRFVQCFSIICYLIISEVGYSGPLSAVPLFQRCFTHLTGTRAPLKHPILQRVRSGELDPVTACFNLLDATKLVDSPALEEDKGFLDDPTIDSKTILRNLYDFHRSWFEVVDFSTSPATDNDGWQDRFLDPTEPALVITRALFQNDVNFKEIVNGNYSVRGWRSDGSVTSPWGGRQRGDLLGIYKYPEIDNHKFHGDLGTPFTDIVKYPFFSGAPRPTTKTYGAGVLGLQPFMIMNSGFMSGGSKANGADLLQRRWARNSMQLLCRDLPTLRNSDVTAIVADYNRLNTNLETAAPFRQAASCMKCHATIDPMAALTRNIVYVKATYEDLNQDGKYPGGHGEPPRGGFQNSGERGERYGDWGSISLSLEPTKSSDVSIRGENVKTSLVEKASDFYLRPPTGVVRYRSYNGDLIEKFISSAPNTSSSMAQLGDILAKGNDLYVCAAKRYFHYFTGITVDLSDPGDPDSVALTPAAQHYRDIVVQLGLRLKEHQKLKTLIKDIMNLPLYRTKEMK